LSNIIKKIACNCTNNKKKLLGIFALIIVLVVTTLFILVKNNILYHEEIVQEQISNAQNEDQLRLEDIIKNKDQERKNDLHEVEVALEKYYDENDSYFVSEKGIKLNDESSEIYSILKEYISVDNFQDPINPEYYYVYKSNGSFFELSARFENLNDDDCEMINENICIYKIITYGKIAKVLTKDETGNNFLEEIALIDMDENTIIVTGDYLDKSDLKIVEMLNLPKSIKTKKIKELSEEDRKSNNLVLIGNADSNDLIFYMYKKSRIIENVNIIDENNLHLATLKRSRSLWNDKKDVFIIETGCLIEEIVKVTGKITVEKFEKDYYYVLLSTDGNKFTLVPDSNYSNEKSFIETMLEVSEKNIEVYGYKKVCNYKKILIANNIAVIGINKIE